MTTDDTRQRLKTALENLDSLPAMPAIAQKLLALDLNSDRGEETLLTLVEQDPQIAAKLVGMANSPAMGLSRKIGSVQEAALVVGIGRVKSIAIGIAALARMGGTPTEHFNPQALWLHSMTIAIVMRALSNFMPRKLRPNEDHIFLAGLLHDIGFMALHHMDPQASESVHALLHTHPDSNVLEVELATLGITHCYIGAQLARHWHLPEELFTVMGYHHVPYVDEVAENNLLLRMLDVAERLLPDLGLLEHTGRPVTEADWEQLGIDPSQAEEITQVANELAVQAAQL